MTTTGLGRLVAVDQRDRQFLMAKVAPAPPILPLHKNWYAQGAWLDQGSTGTCVGHGWAHWVEDGPVTHPGTIDPIALYVEATELDEWPGNEGDLQAGTSVRAGAKALVARGLVAAYWWAWDVETITTALLTAGPVVVGTNWYDGMFQPKPIGPMGRPLLEPGRTRLAGGHCYVLDGVNVVYETVRVKNSWGRDWAKDGFAWMTFETLDRLIAEDGEACLATEIP